MNFPDVYGSGYIVKCTDLRLQYLLYTSSKDTKFRTWIGQWGGPEGTITWTCLATAEPPQEYDLPLAEGFTVAEQYHANTYSKDQCGRVHVMGWVHGAHGTNVTIATLPEGYRPVAEVYAPCYFSGEHEASPVIGRISINTEGAIFGHSDNLANMAYALFNLSFPAV